MQTGVQLSKVKTADSLSPRAPGNAPPPANPVATFVVPLPPTPAPNANAGPSLVEKHAEVEQTEIKPAEAPRSDAVAVVRISRRQLWMGAAAVCALGLLVAGGLYLRTAGRNKDATVALTARRTADGLEVSWDRNASVFTAQGALLMIREGELQKDLYLDLPQLRTGHVLYTPQSNDDLHLRMEVFAASEKAATQSMVLLGKAQPISASANAATGAEAEAAPPVAAPPAAAAGKIPVSASPAPAAVPAAAITLTTPMVSVPAADPPVAKPVPRQFQPPPAQVAASSPVAAVAPPDVELPVLPNNAQGNLPGTVAVNLTPAASALPAPPVTASNPKPAGDVISEPRAIVKVMPVIPADARHWKGSGMEVAVRVKIDPDGRVVEATVQGARTTAANILGKLAVDAARQWRFDPARRGDRKVYADMVLRFKF
jgi:periplasmic protein TonB